MRRVFLFLSLAAAVADASGGQSAQPSTVLVTGRVVRAGGGGPVARARISGASTRDGLGASMVLTDLDGRFSIGILSTAARVSAQKTGYAPQSVPVPPSRSLVITLSLAGAVSGRVIDDAGDPVVGARVTAEDARATTGRNRAIAQAETDDRGEYRLGGLPEAPIVVALTTVGTTAQTVVTAGRIEVAGRSQHRMYFPDAQGRDQAEVFTPGPGDDIDDINFLVPAARSASQPLSVTNAVTNAVPTLVGPASAANPQAATVGLVRGRVVSAAGTPLPRAKVALARVGRFPDVRTADSDRDGGFVFTALPVGVYRVLASKAGYSAAGVGREAITQDTLRTAGREVAVTGEQTADTIELSLAPWSTVTGRVRDDEGDPVQGAIVRLLQVRYLAGRRQLVPVGPTERRTDDRGEYRLFGMPPGAYILSASVHEVAAADSPGYARTYYPGTARAGDARFVEVQPSARLTNLDLDLVRSPTYRVGGRIRNAAGQPTMGGRVQLLTSQRTSAAFIEAVNARIAGDGRFEFPHVAPGVYVMHTQQNSRNGYTEGEFAAVAVTVTDSDVLDLQVQASAGSTVTGRVVLASSVATAPALRTLRIQAIPADADLTPNAWARADLGEDGRFVLAGLNGPRRLMVSNLPAGWTLQAVRVNGIDATDRPLSFGRPEESLADVEVILTDRVAEVSGVVAGAEGRPTPDAHVVLFPLDSGLWFPRSRYLRSTATDTDGSFRIEALPPGSYSAVAVSALPSDGEDAWQDPAWLASLLRDAVTVPLASGEHRRIGTVRIGGR